MTSTRQDPIERLTRRFDYHDPEYTPEVAEIVNREIGKNEGVTYSEAHGGMWILSRYEQVKAAFKDHATYSSGSGVFFPRAAGTPKFSPIDFDPPEHRARRRLMSPPLQQDVVRSLESQVAELTSRMVRPMVERGHGDFTGEVSKPLAIGVLAIALGLSESAQHQIRELTTTLWARLSKNPDLTDFWPEFRQLVSEEVRRAKEEPGDSYLSRLVGAELNGEPLSEETLQSIIVSYCIAGHETTMNTISRMLWYLGSNPLLQERLKAEPDLMPVAADETLRRWCPTDRFTRVTTRDVTIAGTAIPEGSRVVFLLDAANRDPDKFPDPDTFSLDRGNSHQHLSFGFGIHHCMGAHLARLELRIVLQELARHPVYHLTEDPGRHFENGRHIVFEKVPVKFETS
ncbi:cytochrome P450 [Amycolatopsis roodepoortensis]|uniref:Cytochrome P450 n=1 Tax=Amycolatopsis roodepoortensis TaxID=700274 RepID=A0ABR9L6E5_9PSEU|nr:cytochrome P450 [Amycolatopsis roodepoortensis]MBE1576289.1 cytochrome P450 [Amycolatopsis roodepoortensis]UUV29062.1 cytochrome P450 [Amycolatopsis roodepoortensis]